MTNEVKKRKGKYIKNKDLYAAIVRAKANNNRLMTDELAVMLMLLIERYAKSPKFAYYTYNDDMRSHAIVTLCANWWKFNELKYDNAFAYYTQCIKSSFYQILNKERKHRDTLDELRIDCGMDASYGYTLRYNYTNDEEDFHEQLENYNKLNKALDPDVDDVVS